ncbi:hypothetical protein PLICRDRAFT_655451 [Plicaturopsis crispa FD-325 SS-3]|nr:hypothetical protein PLICRDRAFT_655451 [Plicaturopsis crispa FD-325 SS-3]
MATTDDQQTTPLLFRNFDIHLENIARDALRAASARRAGGGMPDGTNGIPDRLSLEQYLAALYFVYASRLDATPAATPQATPQSQAAVPNQAPSTPSANSGARRLASELAANLNRKLASRNPSLGVGLPYPQFDREYAIVREFGQPQKFYAIQRTEIANAPSADVDEPVPDTPSVTNVHVPRSWRRRSSHWPHRRCYAHEATPEATPAPATPAAVPGPSLAGQSPLIPGVVPVYPPTNYGTGPVIPQQQQQQQRRASWVPPWVRNINLRPGHEGQTFALQRNLTANSHSTFSGYPSLRWDIRRPVETARCLTSGNEWIPVTSSLLGEDACTRPTQYLEISLDPVMGFWERDPQCAWGPIMVRSSSNITVRDVLDSIYAYFDKPLLHSEYDAARTRRDNTDIERRLAQAYSWRCNIPGTGRLRDVELANGIRRVDCLWTTSAFGGMHAEQSADGVCRATLRFVSPSVAF